MAHVGVERLGAGGSEEHRSKRKEALERMAEDEADAVERVRQPLVDDPAEATRTARDAEDERLIFPLASDDVK
jgi:hypothetical protein